MKRTKRPLSILLALAVLLGCIYLPAAAAGEQFEVAVLNVQKVTGANYDASSATVSTADPGDTVVLTVGVKNTSNAAVSLNSFTLAMQYGSGIRPVTASDGLNSPFNANACAPNDTLRNDYDWSYKRNTNIDGMVYVAASTSGDG
ncbi:MAG: hypothetical protein IJT94_14575, partial [Oscillibacter sp.]|nr:hypothetical protein [Oscillibacter sp.]